MKMPTFQTSWRAKSHPIPTPFSPQNTIQQKAAATEKEADSNWPSSPPPLIKFSIRKKRNKVELFHMRMDSVFTESQEAFIYN